jgi:hypothetical protein
LVHDEYWLNAIKSRYAGEEQNDLILAAMIIDGVYFALSG